MTTKLKRFLAVAALLMAGTLVLAGCGGGEAPDGQQADEAEHMHDEYCDHDEEWEGFPDVSTYGNEYRQNLIQYREPDADTPIAVMTTSKGEIRIALYPQFAPKAVENFMTHARGGYYDGMIFHRVINDFMIQTGDPTGTGSGGESIFTDEDGNPIPFEGEFNMELWNVRGALAMANPNDPHHNQSQFFIVQCPKVTFPADYMAQAGYEADELDQFIVDILTASGFPKDAASAYLHEGGTPHLDGAHAVFGMVIQGMDVVDKIAAVQTGANDKPVEDVKILSVVIEGDGELGGPRESVTTLPFLIIEGDEPGDEVEAKDETEADTNLPGQ